MPPRSKHVGSPQQKRCYYLVLSIPFLEEITALYRLIYFSNYINAVGVFVTASVVLKERQGKILVHETFFGAFAVQLMGTISPPFCLF